MGILDAPSIQTDTPLISIATPLTYSKSGTGAYLQPIRIPLPAAAIGDRIIDITALLGHAGSAGWAWEIAVYPAGSASPAGAVAAPGALIVQQFPTAPQTESEFEFSISISASKKQAAIFAQNMPTAGILQGQGTSGPIIVSYDFAVDSELWLRVMPQNNDTVTVHKLGVWMRRPTNLSLLSPIFCWGDSLSAGAGATARNDYPTQLARLSGRPVINLGIGGQTAQQIAARVAVVAASASGATHIFQMGRNNVGSPTMLADLQDALAQSVAAVGTNRYLIGSVTNSDTETIGTGNRTAITAANSAIATQYGPHYVDTLSQLATNAGEIPAAYFSDAVSPKVHFTDAGYGILASAYNAALAAAGY